MSFMVCAMVAGAVVGGVVNAVQQYNETGSIDLGQAATAATEGALIGGGVVIAAVAAAAIAPAAVALFTAANADRDPINEINAVTKVVEEAAPDINNAIGQSSAAPDFIVAGSGETIPVPGGALGPFPTDNLNGVRYDSLTGGGNGLHSSVTGVRIMNPTTLFPNGYVSYYKTLVNGALQTIHPYTGQSIPKSSPWWHIPLNTPQ
jgi:hypothetical protein